jgi:hypothetical protein
VPHQPSHHCRTLLGPVVPGVERLELLLDDDARPTINDSREAGVSVDAASLQMLAYFDGKFFQQLPARIEPNRGFVVKRLKRPGLGSPERMDDEVFWRSGAGAGAAGGCHVLCLQS